MEVDLDALTTLFAAQAAQETGSAPALIAHRNNGFVPLAFDDLWSPLGNRWTDEEMEFVRQSVGVLTDEQISDALGRSVNAVKIRRTRYGLGAHTKRPGWLTGNDVAKIFGIDVHGVMRLAERNLIPHDIWPGGVNEKVIMVQEAILYRWACNPMNWPYFLLGAQVTRPDLARMLELKRQRWEDDWWTPGQVAEYHQTGHNLVNKYLLLGWFPRAIRYGNWWILRSEATASHVRFYHGKGAGRCIHWSTGADAFLLLGRAVGLSTSALDAMRGRDLSAGLQAKHRLPNLMRDPQRTLQVIAEHELPVEYDPARGVVFCDWRQVPGRFPIVDQAMRLLLAGGQGMATRHVYAARGVLSAWMDWHAIPGPRALSGRWSTTAQVGQLRKMIDILNKAGIEF